MPAKKLIKEDRRKGVVARKKKAGGGTLKTKNHNPLASDDAGHADRLALYVKRTLVLHGDGYPYHEIAQIIAKEFELEKLPHIATISKWRQQGFDQTTFDIQQLQMQLRIDQFNQLEDMKAKWLPLAKAEALQITRWVRIEGELQPELDENAVKEQIDATKAVVAIMNRQAKLLGLDIEKTITETGEGPQSYMELQLWIIGQAQAMGQTIDVTAEVLELKAGIPEVDEL